MILCSEQLLPNLLKKIWKLNSIKVICKHSDARGSATKRKPGSGRPKLAKNIQALLRNRLLRVRSFLAAPSRPTKVDRQDMLR